MNEAINTIRCPGNALAVTNAPLRELLNFLIYQQQPEMLDERVRRQPRPILPAIPRSIKELKPILGANRLSLGERKLIFDFERAENLQAVLVRNSDAQFWVYFFHCGIGLVSVSYYATAVATTAKLALYGRGRSISHRDEFQWFTHRLEAKNFNRRLTEKTIKRLGKYFVETVNPTLINPYRICPKANQDARSTENYRFVSGSLERLKEVVTWAYFTSQQIERRKDALRQIQIRPVFSFTCGNLRDSPRVESANHPLINAVGALALKENAPFTVLRQKAGRRIGSDNDNWERKNKHFVYFNLEQETRDATPREKITARRYLTEWLKKQSKQGTYVSKIWNLENGDFSN